MGKNLIIVDTSSFLYRNYHAQEPFMVQWQNETFDANAIRGYFYYIFEKVYKSFDADYLVHVLDPIEGTNFRHELYPEYKANRPPTPESLTNQKLRLPEIMSILGEPYIQKSGCESDDVIATLVRKNAEAGGNNLILSSDKDLMQLIDNEHTIMVSYKKKYNEMFGKVNEHEHIIESDVIEKTGIRPDQIADFLALRGDGVDNIPGVPDVGEKTAAQWIQTYGDLSTLITHAHDIKGKKGDRLRQTIHLLPLYRKLTDLDRHVQGVELPEKKEPLWDEAMELLNKMRLHSTEYWQNKLDNGNQKTNISFKP